MNSTRKTKFVKALIEVFESRYEAIAGVDLVKLMKNDMNKTTVYRILDRLEQDGTLHSFVSNDGLKCYAKSFKAEDSSHQHKHPHFQCKSCGKIFCLKIDLQIHKLSSQHHIDTTNVFMTGTCEACI